TVFDDHHVAGLPGDMAPVVDVVAAALEHVEHRTVEMAVLLAVCRGSVRLDMRFHRLDDAGRLRADDALAELTRPAFPRHVAGWIDPLLLEQRLVEMAISAFERAHEGALLGPALPPLVLLLFGKFVGLVMPDARPRLVVHPRHSGASLEAAALGELCTSSQASCDEPCALSLRDNRGRRNALATGASPCAAWP